MISAVYYKHGLMRRSSLENAADVVMCRYDAAFHAENNIIYGTISRNTYKYHQTTAHVRMVVYDHVAFIVDADIYYHICEYDALTEHSKQLSSAWIEPLKINGITEIYYNQERSHEAYILTKRIFHNVITNLDQNLDSFLPNDVIGIIKNMDISQSGLDYVYDPGNPEVWPFKVQHINGFSKRPLYRVVLCKVILNEDILYEALENDGEWQDLPDILDPDNYMEV